VDTSKPQVILLAYLYPPNQEMGALRPFRFKKYLERMGYRCHVVTASPQPGPPQPNVTVVPDELGDMWESAEPPARLPFAARLEMLLRVFFPGHIGYMWARTAIGECRRIVEANPGARFVLFTTYPPIGALFAGVLGAGVPWIADFRDPLAALVFGDRRSYVLAANRKLERQVFKRAAAVVANTEAAAAEWRRRYSHAKVHAIYNGYDPEHAPSARPVPVRDHKLIVHAGTIYHLRNPNLIVEAMARLRKRGEPEALSAKLLFLGTATRSDDINWALFEQAQQEGWLVLQPAVERAEAQRIVEEADGLLIVQPHTAVQVPGKLFEYICVGRPVLAITPRNSAIEDVLTKAVVPHVCLYPDDAPDESDGKLLDYLRLPNTPAPINDWFRANFNAEFQTEALARVIDDVAKPG
jgi:glycosyltransferase involved in cell wall biosynthesis